MSSYPFKEIERKWQRYWEERHTFRTSPDVETSSPKYYVLDMFPYPSGVGLHVGHPLGYIATDILARYKRMCGVNVLHPIGFDAFGLPAEQYAVEHGVHPQVTTNENIQNMLRQLKQLGLSYDWDRSLATSDPAYYKWTQWIFLQLYESYFDFDTRRARPIRNLEADLDSGRKRVSQGRVILPAASGSENAWPGMDRRERDALLASQRLAYMSEVDVNWCPQLGTVLANEEVTSDGRSDRGNYPVFKRPLRQWMLRITAYADRLERDLDLVEWPESIKAMQRNWIGRSEGATADFRIEGTDDAIRVFTTRPDTLFGATYMVLAPEHALVDQITTGDRRAKVEGYRRSSLAQSDVDRMSAAKTKSGVFTGAYAINPVNREQIPIWIADYVLMGYGTGAIMAVPAHDQRDFEFAGAFNLPIRTVVVPPDEWLAERGVARADYIADPTVADEAYIGEGINVNSSGPGIKLDDLDTPTAKRRITAWLEKTQNGAGHINFKLRDWLFSRQRYWGEPFPILHGPDGEIRAVTEEELPVLLPEMDDFRPTATDDPNAAPEPPLGRADLAWRIVEKDGVEYRRELNTMPQWAGSCWYYLRFIDPDNSTCFVDPGAERYWMAPRGIDLYVGGVEHAVLHLLYARFWHKVLFDLGHVSTPEPFGRLFNQGYIQAYAYRDERGIVVAADEVIDQDGSLATEVQDQPGRRYSHREEPVVQEYGKMGKSLKNAVSPDEICEKYGCDTLRLYEMYLGPLEQSKPWNTRDIIGVNRFLRRVWRNFVDPDTNVARTSDVRPGDDSLVALHRTIKRVTDDLERMSFNTAIAALIEFNAKLSDGNSIPASLAEPFVLLLAPFAPHLAEEIWAKMGKEASLAYHQWPSYDEALLLQEEWTIAVQVNGKLRASVVVPAHADKEVVLSRARSDANVVRHLDGLTVHREIYVPGKIVNLVAS